MYVEANVTGENGDINLGNTAIDNVEVQIGGQQIDKHYGHWMEWAELTEPNKV